MKSDENLNIDKRKEPTENPLCKGLNVNVSMPETFEIRMVEASGLADYEIGLYTSSLIFSVATGFLVAYLQEPVKTYLLTNAIIFSLFFFLIFTFSLIKRSKLTKTTKVVKLKAQETLED